MIERLWFWGFTYLPGIAFSGFFWACHQERMVFWQIGGRLAILGIGLLLLLVFASAFVAAA